MSSKWPEQQLGQQEHQVCPRRAVWMAVFLDLLLLLLLLSLLGPPVAITRLARDLRGLSVDRRKTLPHDQKWMQF